MWLCCCCCCCCCCCQVASVVSDSLQPQRWQPTRLPHPWDSPGKSTGVGCPFFLQCMKVKSESEVAQSCLTLSDPMDCSLPGSSVHGIFQARVLEWGAIAISEMWLQMNNNRQGQLGENRFSQTTWISFFFTTLYIDPWFEDHKKQIIIKQDNTGLITVPLTY